MNPDVTKNITSSMSELQLQFLQHLKIQPLQTDLAAPDYQATQPASELIVLPVKDSVGSQSVALQPEPAEITATEPIVTQWISAESSLPLVQDVLVVLQRAGVQAEWFYQSGTSDIHLTDAGLFSAPPQQFFAADSKKQLWRKLVQLLPDHIPTDTNSI